MSQNTKDKFAQQYANGIGQFFPQYRLDLIFINADKDGKSVEDHYVYMTAFYTWLDKVKNVLLVTQTNVYIDHKYATLFSVTIDSSKGSKVYEDISKIVDMYCEGFSCPVVWQTLPCNSQWQNPSKN